MGRKVGQQKERQNEIIAPKFIAERQAQKLRCVDVDRGLRPTPDPRHVVNRPLDDQLRGQGGNGQVEALDSERRDAKQGADQGSHAATGHNPEPERHTVAARHNSRRVPPHRHEGPLSKGDLARVPIENIESNSTDGGERNSVHNAHGVLVVPEYER